METQDVRWKQRFANYRKALERLTKAIQILDEDTERDEDERDLMRTGVVKSFEFTLELAWNVMKDYAEYQGYKDIHGSRDALRKAFSIGLIEDDRWMNSIADRNLASHDYDESVMDNVYSSILSVYHPLFKAFERKMLSLLETELSLS
jgi:nucleotidyltransferase substrate binding protein (TIGR01987 family)